MGEVHNIEKLKASSARLREPPKEARFPPPAPEDGLRLIRAFVSIPDPAIRAAILEMVTEQAKYG